MIMPSVPVETLTLKLRSISAAPRIIVSSWLTTEPRLWGLAYIEADMAWWANFGAKPRHGNNRIYDQAVMVELEGTQRGRALTDLTSDTRDRKCCKADCSNALVNPC